MTDIPYDEYYTKIEDSIIVPKDEFKKETDGKFYSNQLLCYYEEKKGTSDETYYIFNGNKNIKYKLKTDSIVSLFYKVLPEPLPEPLPEVFYIKKGNNFYSCFHSEFDSIGPNLFLKKARNKAINELTGNFLISRTETIEVRNLILKEYENMILKNEKHINDLNKQVINNNILGLPNIDGNTCWLNSIIQNLLYNELFVKYFLYTEFSSENEFHIFWKNFIFALSKANTHNINEIAGKYYKQFNENPKLQIEAGTNQEDVSEAYNKIISLLSEENEYKYDIKINKYLSTLDNRNFQKNFITYLFYNQYITIYIYIDEKEGKTLSHHNNVKLEMLIKLILNNYSRNKNKILVSYNLQKYDHINSELNNYLGNHNQYDESVSEYFCSIIPEISTPIDLILPEISDDTYYIKNYENNNHSLFKNSSKSKYDIDSYEIENNVIDTYKNIMNNQSLKLYKFSYYNILSQTLVFNIKRYNKDSVKLYHKIQIQQKLEFNHLIYNLYSFTLQFGGTDGGHYITYNFKDKNWWRVDGTNKVMDNNCFNNIKIQQNVYLLFYNRSNNKINLFDFIIDNLTTDEKYLINSHNIKRFKKDIKTYNSCIVNENDEEIIKFSVKDDEFNLKMIRSYDIYTLEVLMNQIFCFCKTNKYSKIILEDNADFRDSYDYNCIFNSLIYRLFQSKKSIYLDEKYNFKSTNKDTYNRLTQFIKDNTINTLIIILKFFKTQLEIKLNNEYEILYKQLEPLKSNSLNTILTLDCKYYKLIFKIIRELDINKDKEFKTNNILISNFITKLQEYINDHKKLELTDIRCP